MSVRLFALRQGALDALGDDNAITIGVAGTHDSRYAAMAELSQLRGYLAIPQHSRIRSHQMQKILSTIGYDTKNTISPESSDLYLRDRHRV